MIKKALEEVNRYESVTGVLKTIMGSRDVRFPVKTFIKDGRPANVFDGSLRTEAAELLKLIETGDIASSDVGMFINILNYVNSTLDSMSVSYVLALSHNSKPYIDINDIVDWFIIQNLIHSLGIDDTRWKLPQSWKKV